MKNFNEIKYERINYDDIEIRINELISGLISSSEFNQYLEICKHIISIQNHIEEMYDYADIRNMRDFSDAFFREEMNYWNEYKPRFDLLFLPFYQLIITTDKKDELCKVMPVNFFSSIEYQVKITSDDVIELQQKENRLKTRYRQLNSMKIMYDGEERTLSYISSFFSKTDRDVRKKAHDVVNDFYLMMQNEYDEVFYELVMVRNEIARRLGFVDYSEYSLYKLRRFGYNYDDIKKFRNSIKKYIVPLCKKLSDWQKNEQNLEKLEYYDTIYFNEMPKMLYLGEKLLDNLAVSFGKAEKELGFLYKKMLENDYIDLVSRDNKINFAITNYLVETKMPTITGNFKNSYLDLQTASHEIGHAFQKYCASLEDRNYIVSSLLKYPTFEIAEMFSYAMELIMIRYVDNLFDNYSYKKYCFMKIYNLVTSLPYICLVDEFQEMVYSSDDLNGKKIRNIWMNLVFKYGLERTNSGHSNLENGGYYYRQTHIFLNPFYYIDYALSYFGAFAIWDKCENDLTFFKEIGGVASYYSFDTLVNKYNLSNPFDEKCVKELSEKLWSELIKKKKDLEK